MKVTLPIIVCSTKLADLGIDSIEELEDLHFRSEQLYAYRVIEEEDEIVLYIHNEEFATPLKAETIAILDEILDK